ncbi:hypothetical protein TCAL_10987 [Tigriopus californicus]|uniref:Small-subunit processome Utp12 domain-containing protein n=2 Tax=Tigriopus californicus TaxID=6832 RepID=A0A553NC72_TIGCA|nr:hypothetical protein TCAL_10987 [Tigriopus californicus]|eukprot:TCALIF_10987-PA protein Name:"Similar to WDR3 WD repeat-containing protein 3 (Homo sapiens)" AED:0.04 eAED:0.04 QI:40/1/1/1/1/1/3/41/895
MGEKHEVTAMALTPDWRGEATKLVLGYHDGAIRVFDLDTAECLVTLNGHKSCITALTLDGSGLRLASGSRDTHVIVWDMVNECGLYRLKGHKGPVTQVRFMTDRPVLISSSKDTRVKFWDLDIQHGFATLTRHLTEIWDFVLVKNDQYLVTGSGDAELRIWKLTFDPEFSALNKSQKLDLPGQASKKFKVNETEEDEFEDLDEDNLDADSGLKIEKLGSILRGAPDKVSHVVTDVSGRLMAVHGRDNSVELFLINNEEEVKKRMQKKAKKERRKVAKKEGGSEVQESVSTVNLDTPTIQEEFRRLKVIRAGGKVRHLSLEVTRDETLGVIDLITANNQIESFTIDLIEKNADPEMKLRFDHPGHRSDVRTVQFSSDNTSILSGSHESIKIWNRNVQVCVRTVASGYCLSSLFVPGDRQVIVGTRKGTIQIFDIASAEMTEEIEAHDKEIWAMSLNPDKKGFVTASADHSVKFWAFELLKVGEKRQLSILHKRTLKLDEDAIAVKLSEDGRMIAVSLMDSTIKVFFVDTLKFFLSLYGHKLPALALDISTDSTLIVTGGADKNIKIWGLDFGDCHRSIFAHDDSVTAIQFIPNTHLFFTGGKDGKIKQWDADNFERILTLDGHHGEIWSLAVAPNSRFLVSSGHDKTLRLWERTEEILVLEDERETEREREEEDELATGEARIIPGQEEKEADLPGKKTAETEKGAERLMEAIQVYRDYTEEVKEAESEAKALKKEPIIPVMPPLMLAYQCQTPEHYMAKMIGLIKSSEIEQTLLVLPFDVTVHLLEIIRLLLEKRLSVEVICRIFFFIVEVNFGPLSSAKELRPLLQDLRGLAKDRLQEVKDTVGFNMAALRYTLQQKDEKQKAIELQDAVSKFKDKRKKKKNKERALQTAILTL